MIVSATAHYSKFADSVFKALGKDQPTDPLALMREVQRLEPHPAMHKHLADAMIRPEIHNQVCVNDVKDVKERIETFLKFKGFEKEWEI